MAGSSQTSPPAAGRRKAGSGLHSFTPSPKHFPLCSKGTEKTCCEGSPGRKRATEQVVLQSEILNPSERDCPSWHRTSLVMSNQDSEIPQVQVLVLKALGNQVACRVLAERKRGTLPPPPSCSLALFPKGQKCHSH